MQQAAGMQREDVHTRDARHLPWASPDDSGAEALLRFRPMKRSHRIEPKVRDGLCLPGKILVGFVLVASSGSFGYYGYRLHSRSAHAPALSSLLASSLGRAYAPPQALAASASLSSPAASSIAGSSLLAVRARAPVRRLRAPAARATRRAPHLLHAAERGAAAPVPVG
mmetsp:Transcript_3072/g.8787  ORF Transcript_3072/g.8787 Transcript_3072/m.8787 type:complete len:168 (+) Transcript_3072:84-587(+)